MILQKNKDKNCFLRRGGRDSKIMLGDFYKVAFLRFFFKKTSKNKAILFNYAIILKKEKCLEHKVKVTRPVIFKIERLDIDDKI